MDTCYFCGQTQTRINSEGVEWSTLTNENHWLGDRWIRVNHCENCKVTQRPRKPRQKRQSRVVPATDWNYLAAFSQRKVTR